MKKKLYFILVGVTAIIFVAILIFAKEPVQNVSPLKDRQGELALAGEWVQTKKTINDLLSQVKSEPQNDKIKLQLAQAYIQEGRITGDHQYYDKAAIEFLDQVLDKSENNFDALCLKATVLLSQHHFSEGLHMAKKACALNPYNAFVYGLLCDAYVELGKYDSAVIVCDKMIAIRPDIRSYSRVSYLREIHGDVNGSISAMKMAVAAGYPGLEQTAWARCVLGHLYESSGKIDSAEIQYSITLSERPGYPFAVAGLGKIAKNKGNYDEALQYFRKASKTIKEFSFEDEITDIYRELNKTDAADQNALKVIKMLEPGSGDEEDAGHGHYADLELANAYLKMNDFNKALSHALVEFERRPRNIDVCEALAWVRYKRGEYAEANRNINAALRTGSNDPVLLCRAGLIKYKVNEKESARRLMSRALMSDPYIDDELAVEASNFLAIR